MDTAEICGDMSNGWYGRMDPWLCIWRNKWLHLSDWEQYRQLSNKTLKIGFQGQSKIDFGLDGIHVGGTGWL
jgi:hypothetical protein